ncbi:TMV resistance protein N-like [Dorcoceras hygrometricum]|uniref:TMV resistance protein N-like n=1 Tax=Dorcoceras hygrometricum TaxID=472368 RepID=A0A2Z7B038_9LAMI|nr:TMV resistance protein N-like [Dorcoceras hygrometricum]
MKHRRSAAATNKSRATQGRARPRQTRRNRAMCQQLAHIVARPAIIVDHRVAQPVCDVQPSPLRWRAAHGRTLLLIAQHMAQQLAPDDAHPFRAAAGHWQAINSATSCAEQASDRPLLRVGRACDARACACEEEHRRTRRRPEADLKNIVLFQSEIRRLDTICNSDVVQTMLISCCANVNESDVDVKRNLESAMMTSTFLLEETVISNYDVSNISRQLDGSVMMTSEVMSSQSAIEQKISAVDMRSARDGATSSVEDDKKPSKRKDTRKTIIREKLIAVSTAESSSAFVEAFSQAGVKDMSSPGARLGDSSCNGTFLKKEEGEM